MKTSLLGTVVTKNLSNNDIIFNYSHRVLTEAEKKF